MGDIFICHTLYHVLIALVRALRSRPGKSTLVLSTCVPEAETLRAKLLDAAPDLWDAVLIVDEEKLDAQNSESDFYRLRHPFRKPYFTLPKGHVYISNDWSALGRYLQRERRVYTLCEDTLAARWTLTSTCWTSSVPTPAAPTATGATAPAAARWKAKMPRGAAFLA